MPYIQESSSTSALSSSASEERTQRIRIKNRRKLYLDRHPSYFTSPDLELADPLLYDRCIRRFQSSAEREADGRSKGYSGVLEADLYRSEAKIAALHGANLGDGQGTSSSFRPPSSNTASEIPFSTNHSYVRGERGQVLPEEEDEKPLTKEEGMERWKFEMTLRFLAGKDEDFDYRPVDESEEWDIIEKRDEEERWFDDEEPEWVGGDGEKKETSGETGVLDY